MLSFAILCFDKNFLGGILADILEFELRKKIVELALLQHHKPYEHYRSGPTTFDCAGLIRHLYLEICGIDLYGTEKIVSATSILMTNKIGNLIFYEGQRMVSYLSNLQGGDILFFHTLHGNGYPGHCGMYLQDNRFIHATSSIGKVVISDLNKSMFYRERLVAYKDILSSYREYTKVKKL